MRSYAISRLILGVLLGLGSCIGFTSKAQAAEGLRPDTPVIVAEDLTREADCRRSVDGGPEYPCPLGSVLYVRETTYAEVTAKQLKHWSVRSPNRQQDEDAVLRLAGAASKQSSPSTLLVGHTRLDD